MPSYRSNSIIMTKFYIYMLSNASGMFYVGLTTHLEAIVRKHRKKKMSVFKANFSFNQLEYYEEITDVTHAIDRMEALKHTTFYEKRKLARETSVRKKEVA